MDRQQFVVKSILTPEQLALQGLYHQCGIKVTLDIHCVYCAGADERSFLY